MFEDLEIPVSVFIEKDTGKLTYTLKNKNKLAHSTIYKKTKNTINKNFKQSLFPGDCLKFVDGIYIVDENFDLYQDFSIKYINVDF